MTARHRQTLTSPARQMATASCLRGQPRLASTPVMATLSCHLKGVPMPWHHVAACFFGGLFLANFFPHFIAGMSGARFYTPFATPPFRGLSSPVVNMFYALFNLALAYGLLVLVGSLDLQRMPHVAIAAAGFGLGSVFIARSVTKLRGAGVASARA